MSTDPILLNQLPAAYQTLLEPLATFAFEGRWGERHLSTQDFQKAGRLQQWATDNPLMVDIRDTRRLTVACEGLTKLRKLLKLPPRKGCDFFSDRDAILKALRATRAQGTGPSQASLSVIKPASHWSSLDRFAALELGGTYFRTFIAQQLDPAQATQSSNYLVRQRGARTTIHGRLQWENSVQPLEIRFDTKQLQSGLEVTTKFAIAVGGKTLPPQLAADLLPDLIWATGQWYHNICQWELLEQGLILFDSGSNTLNESARLYLMRFADVIKTHVTGDIEITGHADSVGHRTANVELGFQRAQAVQQFLLEQGMAADHLRIVSIGEAKPIDAHGDNQSNVFNRNVQLHIIPRANPNGCYKFNRGFDPLQPPSHLIVGPCEQYPAHCSGAMLQSNPALR